MGEKAFNVCFSFVFRGFYEDMAMGIGIGMR